MTETNFHQILLPSPLHTHCLGMQTAKNTPTQLPQVIALTGPLGAGKTALVAGIAEELGIKETVSSPTFTYINEYHSGTRPLYHIDLYRLQPENNPPGLHAAAALTQELAEILQQPNALVAIEWAEFWKKYLPPNCLQISLSYVKDDTARLARLTGPTAKLIVEQTQQQNASNKISSNS